MPDELDRDAPRAFKGLWIPAEIWLDVNMTMQEKCFWAEVSSLDGPKGCFASNAYLARFFDLSAKRVSTVLNKLVKSGWLVSTVDKFNGNRRVLHAVVPTQEQGDLSPEPSTPIPVSRDTPIPGSVHHITKGDSKVRTKKEYFPCVHLTEKEHTTLVTDYGPKNTKMMIEKLGNWKGAKGHKYKSDYYAILSWVVKACEVKKLTTSKPSYLCSSCGRSFDKPYCDECGKVCK